MADASTFGTAASEVGLVGTQSDTEARIDEWRALATSRKGVGGRDVEELEDHLRSLIDELEAAGLRPDEAFLIAVKRMGALDDLSHEYAREHSERLWKQLMFSGSATDDDETGATDWSELILMTALALGAGLSVKVGFDVLDDGVAGRNLSLLILPWLTAFFVWRRSIRSSVVAGLVALFAIGGLFANIYPFGGQGHTEVLTGIHLPIVLWFAGVGTAYAGGAWRESDRRLNFLRFSGEWIVYYALIGLGGGLLMAFTSGVFAAVEINVDDIVESWMLPIGAGAAVVVAAWLVEAKQGVIESMAPVLTRLFTPLFTMLFVAFLGAVVATRTWFSVDPDVLIMFDLLLVVVLGLLLYSISARPTGAGPLVSDWLSLALVGTALVIDGLVLAAILGRISEFGFSANKVAAVGENIVVAVNLVWAAWLYLGFLRNRRPVSRLLEWQTAYLPVIAGWAAFVVVAFPPIFGFD